MHLVLDGQGALHAQLTRSLKDAILARRFAAGMRLPATRELAVLLGLSRNTVLGAYEQLEAEGFIEARTGSGSYVADIAPRELPSLVKVDRPMRIARFGRRAQELRAHLPPGTVANAELSGHPAGEVAVAGMAIARQRPATANGVVFMLLEDETGQVNLIVPPPVYEQHRPLVRGEPLLLARGKLERVGRNLNVLVRTLETLGPLAREVAGLAEVQSALPRAHHFGHR